jgi:peptide-methionine (R)-S-oxide reductase
MTDKDYKNKLSEEQYKVLIEKGTEAPFSGKYLGTNDKGMYVCGACGAELFSSDSKYDSKTPGLIGWPSFCEVAKDGAVKFVEDNKLLMKRTEVVCSNCGGHLGHVFDADDSPTGKHYCINSVSLDFKPTQQQPRKGGK